MADRRTSGANSEHGLLRTADRGNPVETFAGRILGASSKEDPAIFQELAEIGRRQKTALTGGYSDIASIEIVQ